MLGVHLASRQDDLVRARRPDESRQQEADAALRAGKAVVDPGAATAGLNETAEVVLGGTIALTAAVAFFGVQATQEIARGGSFDLGFQTMPVVFQQLPLGNLLGALWFFLLFLAGLTSAVAMAQPSVAMLEESWNVSRRRATGLVCGSLFLLAQPVIFFQRFGFLDELDYWAGTLGLVVFALLEVLVFAWVFGIEKGWAEIERGALARPPRFFKFVLKWVTPAYLLGILGFWGWKELPARLAMEGVAEADQPYRVAARILLLAILGLTFWLVRKASQTWAREDDHPAGRGASRFVK